MLRPEVVTQRRRVASRRRRGASERRPQRMVFAVGLRGESACALVRVTADAEVGAVDVGVPDGRPVPSGSLSVAGVEPGLGAGRVIDPGVDAHDSGDRVEAAGVAQLSGGPVLGHRRVGVGVARATCDQGRPRCRRRVRARRANRGRGPLRRCGRRWPRRRRPVPSARSSGRGARRRPRFGRHSCRGRPRPGGSARSSHARGLDRCSTDRRRGGAPRRGRAPPPRSRRWGRLDEASSSGASEDVDAEVPLPVRADRVEAIVVEPSLGAPDRPTGGSSSRRASGPGSRRRHPPASRRPCPSA